MKTIIEMWHKAWPDDGTFVRASAQDLERFADLVRADEREKWMERAAILIRGEREACAEKTGEFARKWWSIHCASNKHMDTTRKAHDDFCALQAAIRARGQA